MIQPTLVAKMKSFGLDIVHTQTEFSVGLIGKLVARLLRVPLLHTYHTMYEDYTHYIAGGHLVSPNLARKFSRVFCNGATAVTTPAEKTREYLLRYGVRKPIHMLPTGIEFDRFKRGLYSDEEIRVARRDMGLNETDPALITIGRVAKEKSIDVVIKALPMLLKTVPNAKYVSVGDGPCIEELKKLTESLDVADSVIFAGPRPWAEIGKYYQAGDVFVSASTTETQGITYVESMAAGCPLIAKRDKSIEEILIHNETGLFFDSAEELAELSGRLLKDAGERKRLADNAYAHIQPLSAEIFVGKMEALYRELIESYPKKR